MDINSEVYDIMNKICEKLIGEYQIGPELDLDVPINFCLNKEADCHESSSISMSYQSIKVINLNGNLFLISVGIPIGHERFDIRDLQGYSSNIVLIPLLSMYFVTNKTIIETVKTRLDEIKKVFYKDCYRKLFKYFVVHEVDKSRENFIKEWMQHIDKSYSPDDIISEEDFVDKMIKYIINQSGELK